MTVLDWLAPLIPNPGDVRRTETGRLPFVQPPPADWEPDF